MSLLPVLQDIFVPDGDEARRWAEEELSKPAYEAAKPTWFDELWRAIGEFIANLFSNGNASGVAPLAIVVIVLILLAAVVVALVVWGRPRSSRTVRRPAQLLGERDDRSAAQLRSDAERAARDRDWDAAVALRFRAIARGLLERDLIDPAPGATAQAISREAATAFFAETEPLHEAATAFDRVRYLRIPAAESDYRAIAALDERLDARRPEAVPA